MLRDVVVEGGEVGVGGALAAVVVEDGEFFGGAVGETHPVEPAEVHSTDERRNDVIGERDAPDIEGVCIGGGLRVGAVGGDDEGGIVLDGDFADGGPILNGEGAGDPGDDVLIFLGVEVDPAEGVGGLLGGEGGCGGQQSCDEDKACAGDDATHVSKYTRGRMLGGRAAALA